MNPAVTEQFLKDTHEAYKKYLGGNLAKKIRGFFSDEPQYQRLHTPYTDILAEYFQTQFGTDILDEIGLLFVEKEGHRRFRYLYWKGLQELMLKNFSQKVYVWCQENQVEYTGHYIEESTLGLQMMCCAGVMPFYEYEHIPGIDWLGNNIGNELSVRQVASVAAQTGKKQVLTETFAGCGWQVTPRDLKRIAEFQFVNGANLICHHLVPYTEYGQRKRDYPAHFSSVNPWIDLEFDTFNRYFTRLGYLLSESKEQVKVAVLHPIRSAYLMYKREEEGFGIIELEKQLTKLLRMLSNRGVNYHFLDETLLAHQGFVEGKKIGCGECSYDYLILSGITNMDASTETMLRMYAENGGHILILGEKPSYLAGESYDYSYLSSDCAIEDIFADQPYHVLNSDILGSEDLNSSSEIYCTYRTIDGMPFLFVQNASETETYDRTFLFGEDICSFERLDLLTLESSIVPLTLHFMPGESAILFPSRQKPEEKKMLSVVKLQLDQALVSYEENYLTVDVIRYSMDGVNYSAPYPYTGLFQKLLEEQYQGEIYFKYEFEVQTIPEKICLRTEPCQAENCWFNGNTVTFEENCESALKLHTADIQSYVHIGTNEFVVKMNWHQEESVYYALFGENVTEGMKNKIVYDSELEPVYLCGKFGVYTQEPFEDAGAGYVRGEQFYIGASPCQISEPVKEGFPFFAGKLTVKQTIHLEQTNVALAINGTQLLAYVRVNSVFAGKLLFENQLDISGCARTGDNEIEVELIISNRNLLGPHHCKGTDEKNFVGPHSFEMNGTWKDGKSPLYDNKYELLCLQSGTAGKGKKHEELQR